MSRSSISTIADNLLQLNLIFIGLQLIQPKLSLSTCNPAPSSDTPNAMMKSAYVTKRPHPGKVADELEIGELPIPELGPKEVLVRIHAAPLNIDDLHVAEGTFLGGLSVIQSRKPTHLRPLVLGSDFAGVVERVGAQAAEFKVGDRVCGLRPFNHMGTWSTHTVAPTENVVNIPDGCSFEQAAGMIMPLYVGMALVKKAKATNGSRVLVIGASGGIGSVVVQLLRAEGEVHVTGVCSFKNADFVKSLGANQVVDYRKGSVQEQLKGEPQYDVVIDMLGGSASYQTGKSLLKSRTGRFLTATGTVAWLGDKKIGLMGYCRMAGTLLYHSVANRLPGSHPYYFVVIATDLRRKSLEKALASGVRANISDRVTLDKESIRSAIRTVQQHRVPGKIVIKML